MDACDASAEMTTAKTLVRRFRPAKITKYGDRGLAHCLPLKSAHIADSMFRQNAIEPARQGDVDAALVMVADTPPGSALLAY